MHAGASKQGNRAGGKREQNSEAFRVSKRSGMLSTRGSSSSVGCEAVDVKVRAQPW
jgi:hypothetical protein